MSDPRPDKQLHPGAKSPRSAAERRLLRLLREETTTGLREYDSALIKLGLALLHQTGIRAPARVRAKIDFIDVDDLLTRLIDSDDELDHLVDRAERLLRVLDRAPDNRGPRQP